MTMTMICKKYNYYNLLNILLISFTLLVPLILIVYLFLIRGVMSSEEEKEKEKEGFIPSKLYMPHLKNIHSGVRMYATDKVKAATDSVHDFLRSCYIIY